MTELERILAPDYLQSLQERTLEQVRAMRTECQEVEVGLSYLRRLAQARLDIIGSELTRRTGGGDPHDLSELISNLPQILADRVRSPGVGRLPQQMAPAVSEADLSAQVDAIVDTDRLTALPDLDDEEVQSLRDALDAFEQEVSGRRRELHQRIDALQAEITRRYEHATEG